MQIKCLVWFITQLKEVSGLRWLIFIMKGNEWKASGWNRKKNTREACIWKLATTIKNDMCSWGRYRRYISPSTVLTYSVIVVVQAISVSLPSGSILKHCLHISYDIPIVWHTLHIYILGHFQTLLSKATYSNSYIDTLMAVAAMQGADQHIRSWFGVQYLAQGHFDMQAREPN